LNGVLTLAPSSIFNITPSGGNSLRGLLLTNYGMVNWSNSTLYAFGPNNAQIYNYGTWNDQWDDEFQGGYGGGTSFFDNFGTLLKSGGHGTTTFDQDVIVNNSGTISVESGIFSILGGGTNSGPGGFATTNGGSLALNNMTFANGAVFNGAASVQLGGNTAINGILTASNLQFNSGSLSGTNVLEGTLTWSGGSLAGTLTVDSNSVLNIVPGGGNGFDGLVLTNYGTVNWTNTPLYGRNDKNASIYNYGLWDAQDDQYFTGGYDGGITLFDNYGTFRKSGHDGRTTLDGNVLFNNTGIVDLQSGTLTLSENTSLAGGTLNFGINSQTNFGAIQFTGSADLSGAVTVDFNNGFLPASGTDFPLLSGPQFSGSLSTGALPFGMAFVYSKTNVDLVWNGITQADWQAGSPVLHGTTTINFLESPGFSVQVVATADGNSYVLGSTPAAGGLGTVSFNASQLPNGIYNLQAVVLNSNGQTVADYSRPAFVNNSLSWHEGILSANQTWGTNAVNAVDQNVLIPSGVTLTIAPGAIVKFADGTGIIVEAGGVLDAGGATTNEPIVFTSLKDDSVGGDSNEDGNQTQPQGGIGMALSLPENSSPVLPCKFATCC
jgi:hypothetical protein